MGNHSCARLSVCAFGLAIGIVWGVSVLGLGISVWLFGFGAHFLEALASFYIGYAPTFLGSIIGLIWGFIDGFIGGILIAWIYNLCAGRCCKAKQD